MFADPQSVTIATIATSLPAVSRNGDSSVYQKADGSVKLSIAHQYKAERSRFTVRLDFSKIAADPLTSANNRVYSGSVYLVADKPNVGYSNSEITDMAAALSAWCTTANLTKVLGGET
jgi:hypothetical protein